MEKFIKTKNGTRYPIKPKEFLKGKLASYANEYGLEHIKTIKTNSGETYEIYDSGFGNMGHVDACAVLKEAIQSDKLTSGKGEISSNAYKVNYKKGSKYLSMIVSATSKEEARKMVESNPDVDLVIDVKDIDMAMAHKLGFDMTESVKPNDTVDQRTQNLSFGNNDRNRILNYLGLDELSDLDDLSDTIAQARLWDMQYADQLKAGTAGYALTTDFENLPELIEGPEYTISEIDSKNGITLFKKELKKHESVTEGLADDNDVDHWYSYKWDANTGVVQVYRDDIPVFTLNGADTEEEAEDMFADAVYDRYDFDLRENILFNKKSSLNEAKCSLKENTQKLTLKEETILVAKEFIAELVKTCKDDIMERESVDLTNKLIAQLQKLLNDSKAVGLQESLIPINESKVMPDMRIKSTDINFFDGETGNIILPAAIYGNKDNIPQVGSQVVIEFADSDFSEDLQQYKVHLVTDDEVELEYITTIIDGYYNTIEDKDLELDENFLGGDDDPFTIIFNEALQQNPFDDMVDAVEDTVDLLNEETEDIPSGEITDLEVYARLIYDALMMREVMADVRVNEEEQFIEIVPDNKDIEFNVIDQLVRDAVMIENVEPEIEVKSETSHIYRFVDAASKGTGFGQEIPKWDE